jgi:hypothetical protein
MQRSFGHPELFENPSHNLGFVTHDVHRHDSTCRKRYLSILAINSSIRERNSLRIGEALPRR